MAKKRESSGFRKSESKNGEISPRIKEPLASRLKAYCKAIGKNVSFVLEEIVTDYLDQHEIDMIRSLDHKVLAQLYIEQKNRILELEKGQK